MRLRKGLVSSKRPFWETIWVSSLSSLTPRPRISSTVSSSERALSISSRSSRSSSLSSGSFCVQNFAFPKNNQVRTSRWKDELSSVAMRKWHWVASVIFQFKSDNSYELNRQFWAVLVRLFPLPLNGWFFRANLISLLLSSQFRMPLSWFRTYPSPVDSNWRTKRTYGWANLVIIVNISRLFVGLY